MFKKKEVKSNLLNWFPLSLNSSQHWPTWVDDYDEKHMLAKRDEVKELDKKLNLILDHLKLTYQPETEQKEPAKLVEKGDFYMQLNEACASMCGGSPIGIKPKKKRKYTKRKKK